MRKLGPWRTIFSFIWAFSPLYTLGLGTPITMITAVYRAPSIPLWVMQPVYTGFFLLFFGLAGAEVGSTEENVFLAIFLFQMFAGTGHALYLRRRVFTPAPPRPGLDALIRREQRVLAADLARRDPALAKELRIGRPDLERTYDDGGLVDINHAPASVLARIPDLTPELAERIVRARTGAGGFTSAAEIGAAADLPSTLTPQITEYAVFLR